jgi:hypothetical protein
MTYQHVEIPAAGSRITLNKDLSLNVPDRPVIPFIEGDGIGVDITPVMRDVVDTAVRKAYGGRRSIVWMEIYAGEKCTRVYGKDTWLAGETLEAIRDFLVGIKGPLTTPVGGGIRSLNVALRQELDLYVCLRPVRWFEGTPSPIKTPAKHQHGDLPREHRGHLRRHRVGGRHAGSAQVHPVPAAGQLPEAVHEGPLPEHARASASSPFRRRAPSASCARRSLRRRQQPPKR